MATKRVVFVEAISNAVYEFSDYPTVVELEQKLSTPQRHTVYVWSSPQHMWGKYSPELLRNYAAMWLDQSSNTVRVCSSDRTPPSSLQNSRELLPIALAQLPQKGVVSSFSLRGFKNLDTTSFNNVQLSDRLTMVLGPNNSGKTSLLSGLQVWSSCYQTWSKRIVQSGAAANESFPMSSIAIGAPVASLFADSNTTGQTSISASTASLPTFSVGVVFNKQGRSHAQPLDYVFEATLTSETEMTVRFVGASLAPLESRIITVSMPSEQDLGLDDLIPLVEKPHIHGLSTGPYCAHVLHILKESSPLRWEALQKHLPRILPDLDDKDPISILHQSGTGLHGLETNYIGILLHFRSSISTPSTPSIDQSPKASSSTSLSDATTPASSTPSTPSSVTPSQSLRKKNLAFEGSGYKKIVWLLAKLLYSDFLRSSSEGSPPPLFFLLLLDELEALIYPQLTMSLLSRMEDMLSWLTNKDKRVRSSATFLSTHSALLFGQLASRPDARVNLLGLRSGILVAERDAQNVWDEAHLCHGIS